MTQKEQQRIEAYFRQQRRDRWLFPLVIVLLSSGIVSILWFMVRISSLLSSLNQMLITPQ
jgi:hypothetical protein